MIIKLNCNWEPDNNQAKLCVEKGDICIFHSFYPNVNTRIELD